MPDAIIRRLHEFKSHVWDHSSDPFQLQFDDRRVLHDFEYKLVMELVELVEEEDPIFAGKIREQFLWIKNKDEELARRYLELLLQLAGLTRNKILTDLRAATQGDGSLTIPSRPDLLVTRSDVWKLAGTYLSRRLKMVLKHIHELEATSLSKSIESINQATWPGFIRQERAKRQGHEAEGRLAVVLSSVGVPFVPSEKADNPLCRDAQLDGISFDLVSPNLEAPRVCFKATVHTSNIGQYGESKDALEVMEAKALLEEKYRDNRPLLMALIDGVGFYSNRAGLEGVLSVADEFCQFRTLWKAVVVCATLTARHRNIFLPRSEIEYYDAFLREYDYLGWIHELNEGADTSELIAAGDGFISPELE